MKSKLVFYIDIGKLSPEDARIFIDRLRDGLQRRAIAEDVEDFIIPIRDGTTRIEVFTRETDKDDWVRQNPHIIDTLVDSRIKVLEAQLFEARRTIEKLQGRKCCSTKRCTSGTLDGDQIPFIS